MADNIGSLAVQVTGSTAGLSAALRTAQHELTKFQKDVDEKTKPRTGGSLGGRLASGFGASVRASASGVGTILEKSLSAATSLPAIGAGVLGGVGMGAFVVESVKMAAAVEDAQTTFGVMLGDMGKAKSLYAELRKLAAETPMTTGEITGAATSLLGNGIAQENIVPTLRVLGDVAAGAGTELKEVALIYNQVRSKGRLYAEELMQFNERNIPLQAELARVMGVADEQLHELISKGKVGFPDLQRALIALTSEGGAFYGMMEARSKTLSGLFSTLKDNAESFLAKFGKIFAEEFNIGPVMKELSSILSQNEGGLERLRSPMRDVRDLLIDAGRIALNWMGEAVLLSARLADDFEGMTGSVEQMYNVLKWTNPLYVGNRLYKDLSGSPKKGSREAKAQEGIDAAKNTFERLAQAAQGKSDPNKADPSDQERWRKFGLNAGVSASVAMDRFAPAIGVAIGHAINKEFTSQAASLTKDMASTLVDGPAKMLVEARKVAELTKEQIDFAKSVRESMNPRAGFNQRINDIHDIFAKGGFHRKDFVGPNADILNDVMAKRARDFAVMQEFDRFAAGVGFGPPRLAAGALRGSVEAASLMNQHRLNRGDAADNVPAILKEQARRQAELNQRAERIARAVEKAMVIQVK